MFHDRFFPREEGGTNVRQVWIRVRALEAAYDAQAGRCGDALAIVDRIGDAVAQLAFTQRRSGALRLPPRPIRRLSGWRKHVAGVPALRPAVFEA